ncbi:hypothetical protein BX600DRAFT_463956 [Xylariales sp. PMI_506]|nr:hypothetical protein BX600DRAFT_463956 [Xylariales sp. PMI_506]
MSDEHVVLADCVDSSSVRSSAMAYYGDLSDTSPTDYALVVTPAGQTATWDCSTTSALFTSTSVTFTATLGKHSGNETYAGNGTNGYDVNNGGFRCWYEYAPNVFQWGSKTCARVYDCNHQAAPTDTSSAICAATTTAAPTSGGGLAVGAVVGIAVGAGVAGLIALVAAFLLWRYVRANKRHRAELEANSFAGAHGTGANGMFKKSPLSFGTYPFSAQQHQHHHWQNSATIASHELESQWQGTMTTTTLRPEELDATSKATELPTPGSRSRRFYEPQREEVESPVLGQPYQPIDDIIVSQPNNQR